MDELFELLARDYEKNVLKLTKYAKTLLRGHIWRGELFAGCADKQELALPGGRSAEDLVLDLFQKLLKETRTWDKSRHPEFIPVLKGMVRSEISNAFTGTENQKAVVLSTTDEDGKKNFDFEENLGARVGELSHATRFLPPGSREEKPGGNTNKLSDEYFDELLKETSGDKELEDVVAAIMGGSEKAAEVVEATGIKVGRVYELNRKLDVISELITKRVALRHLVEKSGKKEGK